MNALKVLFLLLLSMLSIKMTAQIDDLLKNKDITWIAETYNDFSIHESFEDKAGQNSSRSIALKLINKSQGLLSEIYAIQDWLIEAVKNGQLPIFVDENLKKKHSNKIILHADTITDIDPITHLTRIKVVINNPYNKDILLFRAKQIIFYNSKKAQFGMRTLAVAPIYNFREYDYHTNLFVNTPKPLFWFKPKDLNKTQRLSKRNITWARHMNFINGVSIDKDSVKILKNTQGTTPMNHLLTSFETNPKIPFYRQENLNPNRKIDFRERKTMFVNRDTVVHWKENEEKPQFEIIKNDLMASELVRLQLLQNWYWNSRKKRLEIRLIATAPMKEVYFLNTFGYSLPVFYRRTDD